MIPFERLADWVFGDSFDDVEAHLVECDECAATANRLLDLRDALVEAVRDGRVGHFATPALLAKLEAWGLALERYELAPGQVVPCRATPSQHYALATLRFEPPDGGHDAFDLEVAVDGGPALAEVRDVPLGGPGAVMWLEPGDAVRDRPTMVLRLQLHARSGDTRRLLGEYRLAHTGLAPG